jgi:hypothetical protein
MHVEQQLRPAAYREQRHRARPVIAHLDIETRQLRAQVIENAASIDRARRVTGIEPDQRLQVHQRGLEERIHGPDGAFA